MVILRLLVTIPRLAVVLIAAMVASCGRRSASGDSRHISNEPAIKSDSTHGLAMRAAKKRDQKSGSEMARAQREYELHHND